MDLAPPDLIMSSTVTLVGPDMYAALAALRDRLGTVQGVTTSRIGLEAGMTPADYPMVRIVPSSLSNGPTTASRTCVVLIYFGEPIHEFTAGLEGQWHSLLTMERTLLSAMRSVPGVRHVKYLRTVTDEDRIEAYKLLAIEAEVTA